MSAYNELQNALMALVIGHEYGEPMWNEYLQQLADKVNDEQRESNQEPKRSL